MSGPATTEGAAPGPSGPGGRFFAAYVRVLGVPGARAFFAAALVGRLPIAMVNIGIVLLVQGTTGSYAAGGVVAAVYTVAQAVFALVQARWVDAYGQGRVLGTAAVVFALGMTALVVLVRLGAPLTVAWLAAAVGGAALPQLGSCVRARWAHVLERPADRQTAFALEAVADEVVFISGPVLVTLLATLLDPAVGIAVAVVAGTGGALYFAAQHDTEPPHHRRGPETAPREPLPWRVLVPLVVTAAALGVLFGAVEVITVAFGDEKGSQAWAAPLLALYALGSLVAGLVTGAVTWRVGPDTRLRVGTAGMALAMAPLALVDSLPLLGALLLVGGAAIAPTLVALLAITEQVVPRPRLTEGLALMHTGLIGGVAAGAAFGGGAVDAVGASPAWLVCFAAGLVSLAAALSLPRGAILVASDRPG